MDHSLFEEDKIAEMNSAYNVHQVWPDYLLIGLDGGGNGLFKKVVGGDEIYINNMGDPRGPKYFCVNENAIADAIIEDRKEWESESKLYILSIIMVDIESVVLVRKVQEKLGIQLDTVSKVKNLIPGELLISGQYSKVILEQIVYGVDASRYNITESKCG